MPQTELASANRVAFLEQLSASIGEINQLVRDTESPLLFHHSSRVYFWAALAGKRRELKFDPELLSKVAA